jgi:hypothetical protein
MVQQVFGKLLNAGSDFDRNGSLSASIRRLGCYLVFALMVPLPRNRTSSVPLARVAISMLAGFLLHRVAVAPIPNTTSTKG